jgi:23S rRNA (cytosine1962-C5)-methyltransferase
MNYKILKLKKGKEKSLNRKHPWVFSGAFANISPDLDEGELVEIQDHKGSFFALGFFHHGSITVKILAFENIANVEDYIIDRITRALNYRREWLATIANTNCCRLVFGESDSLPGLIVDRYGKTAVIQIHHYGWVAFLPSINKILIDQEEIEAVYHKPTDKVQINPQLCGYLSGARLDDKVEEYGNSFKIDWEEGQKTGFFIDQRESRKKLAQWSKGKRILNTFSYSGGFSIYALKAGAAEAVSVDISQSAVDLAHENAILNQVEQKHEAVASDVFEYLKAKGEEFDIIILDPPAFSKNRRTVHNAIQAYKRLNLLAFKKTQVGGLIFTFSCSQHITPKLFEDTIRAAAIEAKRDIQIIEKLGQPADHPVNIYFPEGEYLKGLILRVN